MSVAGKMMSFFKPRSLDTEFVFLRHSILVPPQGYLFFCRARIQRKNGSRQRTRERKKPERGTNVSLARSLSFGACGNK
jgi:hypothetical protein